jgi:hypothetical protein
MGLGREFTQEHIVKLCLPPELYLALAKFQVGKEVSRSKAGLLLLTKAAYQEKLIERDAYEKLTLRYSRKLIPESAPKLTDPERLERQKLEEKGRLFESVLAQWELMHRPGWRESWLAEAAKYADRVPQAQRLLELKGGKRPG